MQELLLPEQAAAVYAVSGLCTSHSVCADMLLSSNDMINAKPQ